MDRRTRIFDILDTALQPRVLEVTDESHLHEGHAGARPSGETHYAVVIAAPIFAGVSRLACHRRVNDLLAAEFVDGLHALSIKIV